MKITGYAAVFGVLAACGNSPKVETPPAPEDTGADAPVEVFEPTGPHLAFEPIALEGDRSEATFFAFLPGTDDEFLMLERPGVVLHYGLSGDSAALRGSFALPDVYASIDCGLISLAFDPDFEANRFLYLAYCLDETASGVFRFTWNADDYDAVPNSRSQVLVVGDVAAQKPIHNVGKIGFDADGALWALFGDKRLSSEAQNTANDLGALVRIVPDRTPEGAGYTPAAGNAFDAADGSSANIYAYGFRSPWTGLLDGNGRYWVGDVGTDEVEELNLVTAPGQNFGWPLWEGPCSEDCEGMTDPIAWFGHDDDEPYLREDADAEPTEYHVIWVGGLLDPAVGDPYEGLLTGRVLMGDLCAGWIRLLEANDDGDLVRDDLISHLVHVVAWDQASDGYLYAATYGQCVSNKPNRGSELYRAVLAP